MAYPEITGTIEPQGPPWQERIAELLRRIRGGLSGPLTTGSPAVNLWKGVVDKAATPPGYTGLMDPERDMQGLGGSLVGEMPEAWSRWGQGNPPYTMGEEGLAGRLPMLKPGRASDALNIGATLPLEVLSPEIGGAVGAIRRKGDIVTPEVAGRLAEKLLAGGYGAGVRSNEALPEKLAAYLQKTAGKENDPVAKLPLLRREPSSFYDTSTDPLTAAEPGEKLLNLRAARFREDRPDMELPSSTEQGLGIDDVMANALALGKGRVEAYRGAQKVTRASQEDVERAIAVLQGAGTDPDFASAMTRKIATPEARQGILQDRAETLAAGSGIWPENLGDVVGRLPPDATIAITPDTFGPAAKAFGEVYRSPEFLKYIEAMPSEEFKKASFSDLARGFHKANAENLRAWEQVATGVPVGPGLNQKNQWQDLTDRRALEYEGKKMNVCVGKADYGYCDAVEGGTKKIYSLREKATNKPLVTMEVDKEAGGLKWQPPAPSTFPELIRGALEREQGIEGGFDALTSILANKITKMYGDSYYRNRLERELRSGRYLQDDSESWDIITRAFEPDNIEYAARAPTNAAEFEELAKLIGLELPPDWKEKHPGMWFVKQIHGKHNALAKDLSPDLQEEIMAFVRQLGARTERSGDFKDLERVMRGGTAEGRRGLTEEQVATIQAIYDPKEFKLMKAYGRNFLVDKEGFHFYTLDGGKVMFGRMESGRPKIEGMALHEADGRTLSEFSRRLRGAEEPPKDLKEQVEALAARKTAQEAAAREERRLQGYYELPGGNGAEYVRFEDNAIWWQQDPNGDWHQMIAPIGPAGPIRGQAVEFDPDANEVIPDGLLRMLNDAMPEVLQ